MAAIEPAQMDSIYGEYMAVSQLPNTTGGAQLQPTDTARSVRVKNGERSGLRSCSPR